MKPGPSAPLLEAVRAISESRWEGAEVALARAAETAGTRPAALALRGLLEDKRAFPGAGLRWLDAALRIREEAWIFALRGSARRSSGDLQGSLLDLDAALRRSPTPESLSVRADVLNRLGFFRKALRDLGRLSRLEPSSPEPELQAANILFDQAYYPEALAHMARAIRLRPQDAGLLARRARMLFVLNRLGPAQADLDRAAALAPQDTQIIFERLQILLLRGRGSEAQTALEGGALPIPMTEFLLGFLWCRRGDHTRAREHFARVEDDGGRLAERARLYAIVARVLAEEAGAVAGASPQLYLFGLGIRHPYQASVETIRALARCSVIFNNVGDPHVSEFLGLFPAAVRAVVRRPGEPARRRAAEITAALRPGLAAGFLTRIHPFLYRRIAYDLVGQCRRRGVSFRAFGALSLTDAAGLAWKPVPGPVRCALGLRVFDIRRILRRPRDLRREVPAVIYCIADDDRRRALSRLLARRLPASRDVFILGGAGDGEQAPRRVRIADLEDELLLADRGAAIFLPPMERR